VEEKHDSGQNVAVVPSPPGLLAWVLVVSALLIWELVRAAAPVLVASEQSGAGALSISIAGLVIRAALLIVPPVVLYVVWAASRPK